MAAKTIKAPSISDLAIMEEPTKRVYVLAQKNTRRGRVFDEHGNPRGESDFPPRRNLLYRSAIRWDGSDLAKDEKTGKKISGHPVGKRTIRYYDGCTSIFADEQTTDRETLQNYMDTTKERLFANGYLEVYDYDDMLIKYLDMCSYNGESPYRIPTIPAIFLPLDSEKQAEVEAGGLDELEDALEYAKKADFKKMKIHTQFLGISERDLKTGNLLSEKALRTEYRKKAKENPARFIETFNDKSIQVSSWITDALKIGEISTTLIPNKAVWAKKGAIICDMSGIKSEEGILNKLIEFANIPEGQEFMEQLKALYN